MLVNIYGRACTEARGPRPGRSFASFRGRLGFLLAPSTALEWDERLDGKTSAWLCVPLLSEGRHLGLGVPAKCGTVLGGSGGGGRRGTGTFTQRCEVGIGVEWPLQLGPEPEAKGSGIQMLPSRCEDSACILCGLPHF